jgi:hypothetical protein
MAAIEEAKEAEEEAQGPGITQTDAEAIPAEAMAAIEEAKEAEEETQGPDMAQTDLPGETVSTDSGLPNKDVESGPNSETELSTNVEPLPEDKANVDVTPNTGSLEHGEVLVPTRCTIFDGLRRKQVYEIKNILKPAETNPTESKGGSYKKRRNYKKNKSKKMKRRSHKK